MKKYLIIQLLLIFCLFCSPVLAVSDRTALADPSTMDSWQEALSGDSTENSGKVWSDYTVLANPEGKIETGDYGTGGPAKPTTIEIDGRSIPMDTDFMGVFSLMGKSERMDIEGEYSEPKDVVFVVDVSGTHGYSGLLSSFENGTTRIQRTLRAVNKAIDTVMKENDRNRVGVSVYGTSAEVFMPLGRYASDDGEYIKIIKFFPSGTEGLFTLEVTATPDAGTVLTQTKITNDPYARGDLMDTERTVGMKTNLQSGLRSGMKMLSDEPNTIYLDPVLNIYKPRKPVMMVLSDGQANLAYAEPYYAEEISRRDNLFDGETDVILQTLLTAAYFKNKVESHYMINNLDVHTYGLDLDLEVSDPYKALAYSVLDPMNCFNELGYKNSATNSMVLSAYSKFGNWAVGILAGTDKSKFPPLPESCGFSTSDIKAGVYYNTDYSDLNSTFMGDEIFSGEILKVTGDTLHPARGKLEFKAQAGEYMKITDNIGLILFGEYHPAYKYKSSGSTSYYRIGKDGTDRTDIYVKNPAYNDSGSLLSEIEIKATDSLITVLIPESLIPLVTCRMVAHSEDDIDFTTDFGEQSPLRLFFGIGIDTSLFSTYQDIQYRYWSFADRRSSRYEVNWSAKEGTMISAQRISDSYLNENWDEEMARLKFYANKTDLNVSLSLSPSFNNAFYRVADYSMVYTGSDLTGEVTDISGINPDGTYFIGRKIYNGENGKAARIVIARKITGENLLISSGLYNSETDDRNTGILHVYPGLLPEEETGILKSEDLTGTTEKNQWTSSGTGVLVRYGNNGLLYNPLSTDLILEKTWIISEGKGEGSQRDWATKGDTITFKIKAINRSRIYIKEVEIHDPLKYDFWEYVEGSANLNGTYDEETRTVSWFFEEMAPGEEAEMTFQVKIADFVEEGTRFHWWNEIENIWRREWVKSDTTAASVVLSLEKTQGIKGNSLSKNDMVATKDDTITYSLRVKTDSVMEAKNVVVEDILEDGLTYVEGSSNFENVLTVEDQKLRWEIGNIPEDSFLDITYDVRVDPETEKTVFKNHFTVENFNKNQESSFTSNETTLHISDPWGLVVSKTLSAQSGTSVTSADRNTAFSYTVNFQSNDGSLTDSYILLTGNLMSDQVPDRPDLAATSKRSFSPDANGSYTFSLRADEYAFFYLIPQGTTYRVEENGKYESGFIIEPQTRTYRGEITEEIAEVSYTNTKKLPEPVKVSLDGHKVVDMADGSFFNYPLKDGEFSFTLKRNTENPAGDPVPSSGFTVTNNTSGEITFFEDLEFTKVGTYTYTVSEVKGSNTTITYSEDVFTVTVEVSEEYQNGCYTGSLSASVNIRNNDVQSDIEFKNLYAPTPAQIEIKGNKTLLEADGSPAEDHSGFEFELEPGEFLPDDNAYLERGTDFNTDILDYYTKYMKNSGDSTIKGIAKITFTDREPIASVSESNIIDVSYNKKEQIWMWNEGSEVIVSTREEGKTIYCIDGYRMFKGYGSSGISTSGSNILYSSLTEIDFSNFDTSLCTNMSYTFYYCPQLVTVEGLSGWDTSKVTDMSSMFSFCRQLTSLDLSGWDTGNVTTMGSMFYYCEQLTSVGDLSGWDTGNVTDMSYMFYYCKQVTSVGDLSGWDTGNVTTMGSMFYYCEQLTSVGDLSGWNTGKVSSMVSMFSGCSQLTGLDISGWDTGNVTTMASMFDCCYKLTDLDVSGWDTGNVTTMGSMFRYCEQLTGLDLSGWNTENVRSMQYMFVNCPQLTTVGDISDWDTGNVTNTFHMFSGCSQLTSLDLSRWNTSKVTNMSCVFYECSQLTSLDLSGWDTGNVTDMSSMFRTCSRLETIYASDWTSNSQVVSATNVFTSSSKLPRYSSSKTSGAYCKPISEGGYFTDPSESPNYGKTNNTGNTETISLEESIEIESPVEPKTLAPSVERLSASLPLDEAKEESPTIEPQIEEVPLLPYIQKLADTDSLDWPEELPEYLREALSQEDGAFSFGDATFSAAGTYTYYVTERDDGREGVIYNIKRYKVVITTLPNFETGEVESSVHYYDVTNGEEEPLTEVDALHFENRMYAPAKTVIQGEKSLTGKELTENLYQFQILAHEETPNAPLPSETLIGVKDNGEITFPEITYTRPGRYKYTVSEIDDGDIRTKYDPTVYTITVNVRANDFTQELDATVTTEPEGGILFSNAYFNGSPEIKIEKLESLDNIYWTNHLTVSPDEEVTYSLRVWNSGESVAKNVEVRDNLPEGLILIGAEEDPDILENALVWHIPELWPGEEQTYKITVKVPQAENGEIFTNIGEVKYEDPLDPDKPDDWEESNEVEIEVLDYGKVIVNKFQAKGTMDATTKAFIVESGDEVTYTLEVLSIGDSTARNVVVSDSVPEGLTLVEGSISEGGESPDNRNITWDLGNIPTGSRKTLSFKVTVPEVDETTTWRNIAAYRYSNPPEEDPDEPDTDIPTNEVLITQTPDEPDESNLKEIEVRKLQSLDGETFVNTKLTGKSGNIVTYRIEIENTGALDIPDLTVEDEKPNGLILIPESISADGYLLEDGKTIHWDLGFIGVGRVRTVTFSCTIPEEPGTYLNTAVGKYSKDDPDNPEEEVPSNTVELKNTGQVSYTPSITKDILSTSEESGMDKIFNFTISDFDPTDSIIFTGEPTVSIKGSGTVDFSPVSFTGEGRYTFYIKEEQDDSSPGWNYDTTVYKYTVYVEDTGTQLHVKDVEKEMISQSI